MTARVNLPLTPSDLEGLVSYLNEVLPLIQAAFTELSDGLFEIQYKAPTKPKAGMVVYADGVQWNPDATNGEGIYVYKSDTNWHYLG